MQSSKLHYNFSISIELYILNGSKEANQTLFSLQVTLTEIRYIYFITAKVCAQIKYLIKGTHINCHLCFENNHVMLCNRIPLSISIITLTYFSPFEIFLPQISPSSL